MSDFPIGEYFPIVFVHGYEAYEGGRLGPRAKAVCGVTKRLLEINDDVRAILLGGWHLKESGNYTIADAMTNYLIDDGISPQRIITKQCYASLAEDMPARDSWEELIALRKILGRLGISPKAPLQSVAWDFHIPRLKKMYTTYGLANVEIIPAVPDPHEGLRNKKWMERMSRIMRFIDPCGGGIICHEMRRKRTFDTNLEPLIH